MIDFENPQAQHKGKVYVGRDVFELLKNRLGILYGSSFRHGEIEVIYDCMLADNGIVTFDPNLAGAFKALQVEEKSR